MKKFAQKYCAGFSLLDVLGGLTIAMIGIGALFSVMSSFLKTLNQEARELEVSFSVISQLKQAYSLSNKALVEKIEQDLRLQGFTLKKGQLKNLEWQYFLPEDNRWEIFENDIYGYELYNSVGKIILTFPEDILHEAFKGCTETSS